MRKIKLYFFISTLVLLSQSFSFGQPSLNFTVTSITGGYTLTCLKTNLTLSISTNTTNSVLCTWNSLANGTVTGNPVIINNPDSYTISVQDLVTTETKTQALSILQDTVAPSAFGPTAVITITCPTIDTSFPITLSPTFPTGTLNFVFTWTANTMGILTSPNASTVLVGLADTYTCTITNSVNGCSTKVTFSVSCFVGLQEHQTNSPLVNLNPNPFADKINLTFENFNSTTENSFSISDLFGRTIIEYPILHQTSEIFLSNLPNGIYIAKLVQADKIIYHKKIIKHE